MIFNITGRRARARAQVQRLRTMMRIERFLQSRLTVMFNKQFNRAARYVEQGGTVPDYIIDNDVVALKGILRDTYKRTGNVFFKDAEKDFNTGEKSAALPVELKGMAEDFTMAFTAWSRRQMATKVRLISNTTKRTLRRIITRGVQDGKPAQGIAKDIRKARPSINKNRARRIARTEVHSAMNKATDEAVKATRVEFEREWVAVLDDRTRISHAAADGQRQDQNTPFQVGGEKLMQPGDPKGSPGNIINCRCVLIYHSKGVRL